MAKNKKENIFNFLIEKYPAGSILTPSEGFVVYVTDKNKIIHEIKNGKSFMLISFWPNPSIDKVSNHKKEIKILVNNSTYVVEQIKHVGTQEMGWTTIEWQKGSNAWGRLYEIEPFKKLI